MDYKELINKLRYSRVCSDDIAEAATAIETLLAERDAAMKFIPKVCSACKHWDAGECNAPIAGGECVFNLRQAWQWRGPQKGGEEYVSQNYSI